MGGTRKIALCLFSAGFITLLTGFTALKDKKVLNARYIDKYSAKISDSLFAYKFETSNWEYNTFLDAIQKTNPQRYWKCYPDTLGWRSILSYCQPMVEYYHRHPGFANYPAVNIRYESALEYCEWLTELYNRDPKRDFKKVFFSLPTAAEWIMAARGKRKNTMFPWGNYYFRNNRGQFLANFKHVNEAFVVSDKTGNPVLTDSFSMVAGGLNDRAYYTSEVKSFYPNDFGLFNMSGNVAEMTIEKGVGKGGSYNSYGGEIRIDAFKHYGDSSPELGFRVFMKVIEQ
jgi:formylglycine-generating enzyme required for sulfatase activity